MVVILFVMILMTITNLYYVYFWLDKIIRGYSKRKRDEKELIKRLLILMTHTILMEICIFTTTFLIFSLK